MCCAVYGMFFMEEERMYRVKVRTVGDGQHPSEAVVSVNTADGRQEELIVDKRSLEEGWLRIGYPRSKLKPQ